VSEVTRGRQETSLNAALAMAALRLFMVKSALARLARKAPTERMIRRLRWFDARQPRQGTRRRWRIDGEEIGGLACWTFRPLTRGRRPPVVLLHSGGYVIGPIKGEPGFAGALSHLTGRTILMPLYPLSPETPWRASQEAVTAFYRAVVAVTHGRPPDIVGVSAGGGLAVVLALRIAEAGMVPPRRLVLASPWLDLAMTGSNLDDADARDPMLSTELMRRVALIHAGGDDPHHPRLSPVNASLKRLPPITVLHTTEDVLFAGSAEFVRRAAAAGVVISEHVRHGLPHGHVIGGFLPEARRDRRLIAAVLTGEDGTGEYERQERRAVVEPASPRVRDP